MNTDRKRRKTLKQMLTYLIDRLIGKRNSFFRFGRRTKRAPQFHLDGTNEGLFEQFRASQDIGGLDDFSNGESHE